MTRILNATLLAMLVSGGLMRAAPRPGSGPADTTGLRFEISFPASAHAGPITGRVYVMIARENTDEPRLQIGRTGVPFFGRDIDKLGPGQAAAIDGSDLGSPVASLGDLPAGDYFVQAFINVYSEFKRADGHTVWMHDDQWEGQRWTRSPGNLKSAVQRVHLDPKAGGVVKLSAADVLPPVVVPPDTAWVKRFKFQSPTLTKFWGRPIYLGAVVLLPKDYARETISYPVNYIQGHFSLQAPNGFDERNDFSRAWMSDGFPRMLLVTFQHPNPYFDDSYAVNSPNVGPYGDAIMQELLPEVEKRFRVIREPYARVLSGGSTGGWEALALQLLHPDFFGGTWAYCPDSVTFTDVEGINIYEDTNAFYKQYEWRREPTINSRETDGRVRLTSEQRNHFELVSGTRGRSGEQIDIWSAVFGPVGEDGYIDAAVRQAHRRDAARSRALLEGSLRPARVHEAQLANARTEDCGQNPRLHRHDGHVRLEQLHDRDGEVDEDHDQPALRGVLHVRRPQAALLDRSRHARRAVEGNGAVHPGEEAGGRHDAVVEVLNLGLAYGTPLDKMNQNNTIPSMKAGLSPVLLNREDNIAHRESSDQNVCDIAARSQDFWRRGCARYLAVRGVYSEARSVVGGLDVLTLVHLANLGSRCPAHTDHRWWQLARGLPLDREGEFDRHDSSARAEYARAVCVQRRLDSRVVPMARIRQRAIAMSPFHRSSAWPCSGLNSHSPRYCSRSGTIARSTGSGSSSSRS